MTSPVGAPGGPSMGMLGMLDVGGFMSAEVGGCCWMRLNGPGTPVGCGGRGDCGSPNGAMMGAVIGAGGV